MRKTSGVSLLLLIFLSLCLITFSLLSLSGAAADEKLSRKAADRTTEYYNAASEAYRIISEVDTQLAEYLKEAEDNTSPERTWYTQCARIPELLSRMSGIIWDANQRTLAFDVTVSDSQVLHVVLSVHYPESDSDTMYEITSWKIVNIQEWNPDKSQKLYRKGVSS